ncbi:MFS transporter [Sporomusa acidovorans]|uniref:Staphyloferrin B transporter n=1 Tax=Sporomusa acidovorans (strain ATCC 49682 / DSM 3132 / Mol) TaxID=1123286 RepID=A0ABZ3J8A2_SPOA4|nr:MFS transporter [Sporomusa acidovorans]OZC17534.1 tetracycline resistance protein, class B [Sporomusa acidovorans DSM 3132]SDF08767.1 MFS transporter, DHA1 family, multidrug resistance protein [Sporomusa acidovorans]
MVLHWRRNLFTLALAVMLSGSSYTMVIPFLPLYLLDIGASPQNVNMWSGLVLSITFLVAAVLAPYWGRCADKSGRRRMVMRAGFSLAVVYFLGGLVRNPVDLFIVRLLQGFANGFVPAAMAIVAASTPKEHLGFSLGIMQTTLLIGGILGPLMGGALSHIFGMRFSFMVSAGIIFCGTLLVGALVVEPATENESCPQESGSILEDLKTALANRRLVQMLLLLFAVQAVGMVLQPVIALYVAELQGSMEGVALKAGFVFSLAGIAGALSAPLWGRLGQSGGFFKVMLIAFLGAGVFNFWQYFASNLVQFGVLQFLYGLFIVGVFPAINAIAASSADAGSQGRVFGLTTTANQLGQMLGPVMGGVLSSWLGISSVFIFTGSILLLLGGVVFFEFMYGVCPEEQTQS